MSDGKVHYTRSGQAGHIVFDNQGALNALTLEMWTSLGEICREIAQDPTLRVVTLRGAGGKSFVSGTDIGVFLSFESGDDGIVYERKMDECIGLVENLPMPTLAIVEGWAVGGGIALAFACDFRVASTESRFGSPIGRSIGNCLSAKGYARLVGHVGVTQAKRILLLGEMVTAQELAALGLLQRVVDPADLDAAAEAICERAAENAPLTSRASKEAIRRLVYNNVPDIDDLIRLVYGSDDFKIGVRRFLDKHPRTWTGK